VKADVGVGSLKIGRSAFDTDFDRTHFDFGPVVSELGENTACET
jgi:hypothetical protein